MLPHIKKRQEEINQGIISLYKGESAMKMEGNKEPQVEDNLEKGAKVPVGTVSNGYKKVGEGKWQKVSEHYNMTKQEHSYQATKHAEHSTKVLDRHKDSNAKTKDAVTRGSKDRQRAHEIMAQNLDEKEYSDAEVMADKKEGGNKSNAGVEKYVNEKLSGSKMHELFDEMGIDMPEKLEGEEYESAMDEVREAAIKHFTKNPELMKGEEVVEFNYHGAYEHSEIIRKQIANSFKK